jgi:hypothetical protein
MFMLRTLRSIKFLFMGPVILAFLVVVNWMTYSGEWWVKWAALGIGLAWVLALFRVIRALLLVGGLAALVSYLRRKP